MNNKDTEYQQNFTFVVILYSDNEEELISSDKPTHGWEGREQNRLTGSQNES